MPKSKHRKKKSAAIAKPQSCWIGTGSKPAVEPGEYDEHVVIDLGRAIGFDVPPSQLGPEAATPFIGYIKSGMYGAAVLWQIDGNVGKEIVPAAATAHAERAAGGRRCITILTEPERFDAWMRVLPEGLPVTSSATWGKSA
jgi:hypothetical protein